MFPLPKNLGSSLGFIGNDPKLAFRTQPSGIARLAEKQNIAETDDAYWSQVSNSLAQSSVCQIDYRITNESGPIVLDRLST